VVNVTPRPHFTPGKDPVPIVWEAGRAPAFLYPVFLEKFVTDLLSKYEWEVLPHALHSPDMTPPDFDSFLKLKEPMRGHGFPSQGEVSAAVTRAI